MSTRYGLVSYPHLHSQAILSRDRVRLRARCVEVKVLLPSPDIDRKVNADIDEQSKTSTLPTVEEIYKYVKNHPDSTVCQIRDRFKQRGDTFVSFKKPGCKTKEEVVAFGIKPEFFPLLQEFWKRDDVRVYGGHWAQIACMMNDRQRYIGPDEFLPVCTSIKTA
jgi:hypothetical protein